MFHEEDQAPGLQQAPVSDITGQQKTDINCGVVPSQLPSGVHQELLDQKHGGGSPEKRQAFTEDLDPEASGGICQERNRETIFL